MFCFDNYKPTEDDSPNSPSITTYFILAAHRAVRAGVSKYMGGGGGEDVV